MKRVLTSCLVVLICLTAFISGYSKGCYSYAEDVQFMSDKELEAAYQAYLQSKGGGFIGTAGARYTYTTGKLLNFITSDANTTGITTIDELKSQLTWQKSYLENGNGYLSLGLTNRGMGLLNLYTQYLMQQHYFGNGVQENENGMFDDDIDNLVYSGIYFTDADGYSCMVFVSDVTGQGVQGQVLYYGTPYKYNRTMLISTRNAGNDAVFHTTQSQTITSTLNNIGSGNGLSGYCFDMNRVAYLYEPYDPNNTSLYDQNVVYDAYPCVYKNSNSNRIYLGFYNKYAKNHQTSYSENLMELQEITGGNKENSNIYFYTNNNNNINVYPTINEGDNLYITPKVDVGVDGEVNFQPYIINEGDTITNVVNNYYVDSGTKDKTITVPSDNPSGGGGGSSDNPSGGNPPNWTNPFPHISPDGEGGFNFNFQLPDLNIDWNISGLKDKFPFSIPFDLIHFVEVLNAEPETPEFDWTIDLKIYQWHIDADLHEFDNLAGIVRNVEFIGFCITLVMITRRMIKG